MKYMFGLCPSFKAFKTLVILWIVGERSVFFIHNNLLSATSGFILLRWVMKNAGWLWPEPTQWLEDWDFQPHSCLLGREREGDWFNHQWSMTWSTIPTKWSLHKSPNQRGSGASGMVSRPTCQEYGALQLETDRALVLGTFLDLTLYTSSSVHLLLSYPL